IQAGIFLVLLVTLNGLLFQPFLRLHEERHRKMGGAAEEVARLERESAEDREAYLAKIHAARAKAQAEREALVNEARDQERKQLADVRNEIAKSLNASRQELHSEEARAAKA